MELCDNLSGSVMHDDHSYFEKLGILFPLIAFERRMTYILGISHQSIKQDKTISPLRQIKEYSFKRPKFTVTMEALDNLEEHDDDTSDEYDLIQENDAHFEIPIRMHLKRQCQVEKNFELGKNDKENLGDSNYSLEKNLFCPKCPFKCETTEELVKHNRFYHQKWPIATECQDKPPSSSNQNDEELLNNFPEIN